MAELIDKGALLETLKQEKQRFKGEMYKAAVCMVEDAIRRMPTVTEAEIRASAIDEFAEKLNKKITEFVLEHQKQLTFVSGVSMGWKFVDEIAEQLKEE